MNLILCISSQPYPGEDGAYPGAASTFAPHNRLVAPLLAHDLLRLGAKCKGSTLWDFALVCLTRSSDCGTNRRWSAALTDTKA